MPRLLTARYTVDVGVILHPIYPTHIQYVNKTFDAVEDSINYLKEQGYEFRTFYDFM